MNENDRYYEEELQYLLEGGREYARLHPERARYLNWTDARARDPHVERLLEAFAFLSGNIRRRLDDDFPELTHALLDLVWPHHLRPIPSLAVLELRPKGELREPRTLERGFLVDSKVTSAEVTCRFRTAYDVEVFPFRLADAGIRVDPAGRQRLRFDFQLLPGADPTKLAVPRLRFYLAAEPSIAFEIYRLLRTEVDAVTLRVGEDPKRLLPADSWKPVGFAAGEEVLPYPPLSFPGFRLLAEYFAFPEKFLFLDLVGLGALPLGSKDDRFAVEVGFRGRLPESLHPTAEDFRLYATPIVNAFPKDGEPIPVAHLKGRHRVLGDFVHPDAYEVLSIDAVESLRAEDGARLARHPFYSFAHDPEDPEAAAGEAGVYYHATSKRGLDGGWQTWLSLISKLPGRLPSEETLSLSLTCSNGRLCHEVGIEEIRHPAPGGPRVDFATFGNITRPTDPAYPWLGQGTEWRLISQMALNLTSVAEASALRALLALYDPGERPANRRRIDAIRRVDLAPREILDRGAPIRGAVLTVTVEESHFDDAGDLLLFGDVLASFFALYSPINSFTELVLAKSPSGEVLRCKAQGQKRLL